MWSTRRGCDLPNKIMPDSSFRIHALQIVLAHTRPPDSNLQVPSGPEDETLTQISDMIMQKSDSGDNYHVQCHFTHQQYTIGLAYCRSKGLTGSVAILWSLCRSEIVTRILTMTADANMQILSRTIRILFPILDTVRSQNVLPI